MAASLADAAAQEAKGDSAAAIRTYRSICIEASPSQANAQATEAAIAKLCALYTKQHDANALAKMLTELRPFFAVIPKAKTAKLVKNIIDAVAKVPNTTKLQVQLCREQAEWAKAEKRSFLRQRLELRLATLLLELCDYAPALTLITRLLTEVKRLDDKLLLVDIHLVESRVHHALRNVAKAKAALTASRTAANAIYVPPTVQAHIDMQSGVLQAEEKDYKTGYSYFFEAFEQLGALDENVLALRALKYMLLCKVMGGQAHEVANIASTKGGVKYAGRDIDALKAVAAAHKARTLKDFEVAKKDYIDVLTSDAIVDGHLRVLYDDLLELNVMRLLEPYSRVDVSYVASQLELESGMVEAKISQMILDKKLDAVLDDAGVLKIFSEEASKGGYPDALDTIENLDKVVSALFVRSAKLMAS